MNKIIKMGTLCTYRSQVGQHADFSVVSMSLLKTRTTAIVLVSNRAQVR